jgi:4-amino-4-deoxy-L-arabinose transferase-like glycosyltransferase
LLLVVVVGLVLGVLLQGARGLYRPDEGRYTAIAVSMLRSGDWIHPHVNHETAHYAKPPLTYWAIAASLALLGRNEFAARLPNALAFLLTLLALWLAARRVLPRRPWLPVVLYATCAFPQGAHTVVTTDTLLTLFTTTAGCAFLAWRFDERRPPSLRLLMWLALGLGFFTKGPPALLPALGIVLFTLWQDGPRRLRDLVSWPGAVLALLIGLGWYVAVIVSQHGLVTYFMRDEVVGRIFVNEHHRNANPLFDVKVYVPILLLGCFPWVWQVWRGLLRGLRGWKDAARPVQRFLLCWLLPGVAVFFAVPSRLPLYVLQLFPPLVLLASLHAPEGFLRGRRAAWLVGALVLVGSGAVWGASRLHMADDGRPLARAIRADVPFAPREVLFLRKPHLALSLYLDCEVEQIALVPGVVVDGHPLQSLAQEMAEREPDRLFCVDPSLVGDFETTARRDSLAFDALGNAAGYALYVPHGLPASHGPPR